MIPSTAPSTSNYARDIVSFYMVQGNGFFGSLMA